MPLKNFYRDYHDCLVVGFLFTLLLLLKISLLLAFCFLHATLEEAPHDYYAHKTRLIVYQEKTLC